MSFQYDQYLANHRANVKRGFDWLCENLPDVTNDISDAAWQIEFAHDKSKDEEDEYNAYDAYFYGNNRSYKVVQDYQRAWLTHIHRNPHHWQYWILIHDDMENGELETILEMPYDYIVEMICDWWSFSWQSGNLYEIFKWYEEHSKYIKLAQTTKITVEYILDNMKKKLQALQYADQSAMQPGCYRAHYNKLIFHFSGKIKEVLACLLVGNSSNLNIITADAVMQAINDCELG